METTAPTRFHAIIDSRTELIALEGERLILTERFRDFAHAIGLGFVGGCNASQYKLPCRDTFQRKPITHQQFGKGHGNISWSDIEPQDDVFSTLNTIVAKQCSLYHRWAESPEKDTPEQAATRAEWSSILSNWRDLAQRTQLALPYRESKWR